MFKTKYFINFQQLTGQHIASFQSDYIRFVIVPVRYVPW